MPDYRPIMKLMCQAHGIPIPEAEYPFNKLSPYPARSKTGRIRLWRLDFAWPKEAHDLYSPVALEIDGGVWTGGRHTRGQGYIGDMEKFNEAVLQGWMCLHCTPTQLKTFEIAPLIKRALGLL